MKEHVDKGTLISIPLLDMETPVIQSYCSYQSDNKLAELLLSYKDIKK